MCSENKYSKTHYVETLKPTIELCSTTLLMSEMRIKLILVVVHSICLCCLEAVFTGKTSPRFRERVENVHLNNFLGKSVPQVGKK